jgi:hypothetical protein
MINYYFKLLFCLFLTLKTSLVFSQPWQRSLRENEVPNFYQLRRSMAVSLDGLESSKGKGYKVSKRWENYWESRVFPDGSFPQADLARNNWESYQVGQSPAAIQPGSTWTALGPSSSTGGYAGIGRVNRITFHPTNSSIIFACTAGGGLWKTTNGGSSWINLTDNLPSIGTSGLLIHPTNPNVVYAAVLGDIFKPDAMRGVFKTTDGGQNWEKVLFVNDVSGAVDLAETVHVRPRRLGINTLDPEMALSVWDEEVAMVAGKLRQNHAFLGTARQQTFSLGVNRKAWLDIDTDGLVSVKNFRIDRHRISFASQVPGYSGTRGDIVFNSDPNDAQPFAWVCLGAFRWQPLKAVQ